MTCSKSLRHRQSGFTLIEIAIVLLIIGLMLGTVLGPLSKQREIQRIRSTETLLQEAQEALLGFTARHGFLPCPATTTSNGLESRVSGATSDCTNEHGFLPSNSLGLTGHFNNQGLLTDEWSGALRYSLNNVNTWEYAKTITLQSTPASFSICSASGCGSGKLLASNIVAVIFSLGPDQSTTTASADQQENIDSDDQFVTRTFSEGTTTEFDDIVTWVSPNILALHLVKSGRLSH